MSTLSISCNDLFLRDLTESSFYTEGIRRQQVLGATHSNTGEARLMPDLTFFPDVWGSWPVLVSPTRTRGDPGARVGNSKLHAACTPSVWDYSRASLGGNLGFTAAWHCALESPPSCPSAAVKEGALPPLALERCSMS